MTEMQRATVVAQNRGDWFCNIIIFACYLPLWVQSNEACQARMIMKEFNPNMILFVEVASMIYPVLIVLTVINNHLFSKGTRIGHPGRYLCHVNYVNYTILFFRIALMSYGIHYSWTAEQFELRTDSDP